MAVFDLQYGLQEDKTDRKEFIPSLEGHSTRCQHQPTIFYLHLHLPKI